MQLPQFEDIVERVLTFEKRSGSKLIANYLKDVSFFLLLVSAVRECNIEQHLLTVRNMIYLAFAYDHQNYVRYNTYQNFYQYTLKQIDHQAFHELKTRGIGRSITGENFSITVYLQNCSTKRPKVLLIRFALDSVQTRMQ